jgi:hypothetical protein
MRSFHILTRGSRYICVVDQSLGAGPLNLTVDFPRDESLFDLGVRRGQSVRLALDSILIGEDALTFSLAHAAIYERRQHIQGAHRIAVLDSNLSLIQSVAARAQYPLSDGPILDGFAASFAATAIRIGLTNLTAAIRSRDIPGISEAARCMAGLGPGLTPAADDLLTGLITGLRWASEIVDTSSSYAGRVSEAILASSLGRTTILSEEMLRCAAEGQIGEPVAVLLEAALNRDPAEVTDRALRVLAIGDTSGGALLTGLSQGITLGFELAAERALI